MGPFLGAILAAFLATLALDLDLGRVAEEVDRTTPTVLAIGLIVFAWLTSRFHHHSPEHEGRRPPPPWARPFDLVVYGLLLFQTDWTIVAREATLDLPFLRHLMTLAPYFLATLARVDAAVPPETEEEAHAWPRSRIVGFHARLLLIPILPLLLINGVRDAVASIGSVKVLFVAYPVAEYGFFAVLFVAALVFMPRLLSGLLATKPLPGGPLRKSLEDHLARENVRIGGIDEVDTGGLIANAAYLGLSTRLGRIFISDALLGAMPPDEIRAVFAHEVAHGTRRHLVWILLLFVGLMFCSYLPQDFFAERTVRNLVGTDASAKTVVGIRETAAVLGMLLPLLCGVVAFVAISRRFEVEADLVASESLGDAELFSRALIRVGLIAGKPIDRHGMRHFSIALRTAIVRACAVDAGERGRWFRRIHGSKLAIAGFVALIAAGVAWKLPHDLDLGHAKRELMAAGDESPRDISRLREAADHARAALSSRSTRNEAARMGITALVGLADELLRRGNPGDFDEARAIARDLEKNWPRGDLVGDFNRMMLEVELDAIDPARKLESLHADVRAAQARLQDLLTVLPRDRSADLCEQELRFLAAATGAESGEFRHEPDSFESSRLLAILRRAQINGVETRDARSALESWSSDAAWRRVVLARALGGRPPSEVLDGLVAAETRRSAR